MIVIVGPTGHPGRRLLCIPVCDLPTAPDTEIITVRKAPRYRVRALIADVAFPHCVRNAIVNRPMLPMAPFASRQAPPM